MWSCGVSPEGTGSTNWPTSPLWGADTNTTAPSRVAQREDFIFIKNSIRRNQPRIVSTFLNYKTAGTDWTDSIIGYFQIITSWLLVRQNHIFHIMLLHSTYFTGSCDGHPEPAVRCASFPPKFIKILNVKTVVNFGAALTGSQCPSKLNTEHVAEILQRNQTRRVILMLIINSHEIRSYCRQLPIYTFKLGGRGFKVPVKSNKNVTLRSQKNLKHVTKMLPFSGGKDSRPSLALQREDFILF